MRKFVWLTALFLCFATGASAFWQSRDSGYNVSVGGSTYQGPGDIVSGASIWGSCARAYNAAYANGTNPLCDLVDSAAPTVVICTLRAATTGFVDLTGTYCTGSVTPSAKCAAATGGVCNVHRIYDQSGNANNMVSNGAAANQCQLLFSAINGLPGVNCANGSVTLYDSGSTIALVAPITFSSVTERTGSTTSQQTAIGVGGGVAALGFGAATNTARVQDDSGNGTSATASDSAFHALQGVIASGASATIVTVDNTDTTTTITPSLSTEKIRMTRTGGTGNLSGTVMEAGVWLSGFNGTQRTSMNTNQHGTSGYNF